MLLSGQQEKRKTGPQAELDHRQVEFEILCNDPDGWFWGLLGFFVWLGFFWFGGCFFFFKLRREGIRYM